MLPLAALCLLLAAGPPAPIEPDNRPDLAPARMLRIEPADVGVGMLGIELRLARFTLRSDRYRVGIAALEGGVAMDMFSVTTFLPVHVGVTLWSNPVEADLGRARFYGMLPDVYVEFTGSLLGDALRFEPGCRLSLNCDVDWYGLGLGFEGGWFSNITHDYNRHESTRRLSFWYLGLRAKLLVAGIGL